VPPVDFDDIFLGPEDEPPNRKRKAGRKNVERLQPLPGPFTRVPIQWLIKPGRKQVFRARERLFLYLLYHSLWGQRGVTLTEAVFEEIGTPKRTIYNTLCWLKANGWVRIERARGSTLVVWPVVLSA
jgi:hypothetical protein